MNTDIRTLQPGDREAWTPLWQGYLTFYKSDLDPEITESTWSRLMASGEDPHGLCVVDEQGQLIGFVHYLFHRSTWSLTEYCYLEDLFVGEAARGSGAGRALIEAVGAAARDRGATCVYWHTQEFNTTARRLYDSVAELTPFVKYEYPRSDT